MCYCLLLAVYITFFPFIANGSEYLLPFNRIKIGIDINKLQAISPDMKTAFEKKNKNGNIIECIAYIPIQDNKFWDSSIIKIIDGKIESYSLVITKDFVKAKNNVPEIITMLIKQFGDGYQEEVGQLMDKKGNYYAPVMVWSYDNKFYGFCFTPLSKYKEGDIFNCQLSVMSQDKKLNNLFVITENGNKQKSVLFEEVNKLRTSLFSTEEE